MLRVLLVSTIVLHAAAAAGQERHTQRVQALTRVVLLATEPARSEWCGRPTHIRACTQFAGVELTATTVEDRGRWRVRARGKFIALIALLDTSRYRHELMHIHDIEQSIDAYLLGLEDDSFATRAAAEEARVEAVRRFESKVRGFAEESNLKRDGYARE